MKNKLIIALTVAIISFAGFLFGRQWLNKTDNAEIKLFLESFANDLQTKSADSTATLFAVKQRKKDVILILNVLSGKTAANGKSKSLFATTVDVENAEINIISETLADVKIPVSLKHEGLPEFQSALNITIQKQKESNFRIIAFNGEDLFTDFVAYENAIRSRTRPEKDIFSPQTLQAFKIAAQLKSKYDSVIWFTYIENKPLFYVVNGKWDFYGAMYERRSDEDEEKPHHKMGLVDAEAREIIPADFDLIHNVSGTFEGLIEVEKDGKRGFYNLFGEKVVPVEYEQILPVQDKEHAAVLGTGDGYYWLNKDFSVSERDSTIRIADILPKVYNYKNTFNVSENDVKNLIEFNSREEHGTLYLPPSYLADWKIVGKSETFKNPLRKNIEFFDISSSVQIKYSKNTHAESWLEAAVYSIRDNYIGGRSDFYERTSVMMIDHKRNRVYSLSIADNEYGQAERCSTFGIKAISENLFEVKNNSGVIDMEMNDKFMTEMPVYHYINIDNGKTSEISTNRRFSFTKYAEMDDSYLNGCYVIDDKITDRLSKDFLTYIKMEIYADYNYIFPEEKWVKIFEDNFPGYKASRADVSSLLTETDRHNIDFLDRKIAEASSRKLAVKR